MGFKKEQEGCARQGVEASPVKAQDVSSQGIIKNQRDWVGLQQSGAESRAGRALGECQSKGVGADHEF